MLVWNNDVKIRRPLHWHHSLTHTHTDTRSDNVESWCCCCSIVQCLTKWIFFSFPFRFFRSLCVRRRSRSVVVIRFSRRSDKLGIDKTVACECVCVGFYMWRCIRAYVCVFTTQHKILNMNSSTASECVCASIWMYEREGEKERHYMRRTMLSNAPYYPYIHNLCW